MRPAQHATSRADAEPLGAAVEHVYGIAAGDDLGDGIAAARAFVQLEVGLGNEQLGRFFGSHGPTAGAQEHQQCGGTGEQGPN